MINNKEDERKTLEREYRRLDRLERRDYSLRNDDRTALKTASFFLLIGCFSILIWLAGHKTGKDKCKMLGGIYDRHKLT